MTRGYFITGTDTGVGKTLASCAIIHALRGAGVRVAAMKPVASGCEATAAGLRNEDALQLIRSSALDLPYEQVNPYAFAPAIAPHIAAAESGCEICLQTIVRNFESLAGTADAVVVEGAGGWLVPINAQETIEDLAVALQLPVILVVNLRLGCINHALLSAAAIESSGLPLAGWIANQAQADCNHQADIIASLTTRMAAPLLGTIPHDPSAATSPAQLSQYLNLPANPPC